MCSDRWHQQDDPALYSADGGGRPWQDLTEAARAPLQPNPTRRHGFEGYATTSIVDPCKLLLTTPGIDARSSEFGIPATILAHYSVKRHRAGRSAINSILFLLTPAESAEKWRSW